MIILLKQQQTQPDHCPHCNAKLDGFTSVGHLNAPKPGDVTLCAYCATVLTFTPAGLQLGTREHFNMLPLAVIKAVESLSQKTVQVREAPALSA